MPGLAQKGNHQFGSDSAAWFQTLSSSNGSVLPHGFWSKHRNDISYNQLQKFWIELSPQARQKLLRIDKQTLFEQARKNLYCSRCNGLLLECFLQIIMYGKSMQHEVAGGLLTSTRSGASENRDDCDTSLTNECQDDAQDPSVHPWGGLTATRDGLLTLLDCYMCSKSLKGLQNVFDSARARERERELLYPDACGGGGRGWISQGMAGYGRGHGTRETCALHTARLSVDTLVDFWSALGEETRLSILRMKEEDFIERLMYRFESKRFCRDCRRNVIREFKELKELKRIRKEPRCTSWFCVADTTFQYEVSHDTIQADWHEAFVDSFGTYHHFEWAVGTGEGKSDILDFENVGLSGRVQVNGLDLSGLTACYITLRAWKMDGRCSELSVKAHALKGQQCVHCRLVVGDGFVTITRGESIRRFFEHAEEAEEEEDDDSMDKDGNELDGECSRPQKHAKSPELAREFLLDAATIIFKEQVEKAFREGTARQNAHSIFVCLALKLLEERVHVACKEIITLEKQTKLLEEEEREKREEEERKARRRTKEREKKLRRKERLREKDKERDKEGEKTRHEPNQTFDLSKEEDSSPSLEEEEEEEEPDSNTEPVPSSPVYPEIQHKNDSDGKEETGNATYSRRRLKYRKEPHPDPTFRWSTDRRRFPVLENGNGFEKHSRNCSILKSNPKNGASKFGYNNRYGGGFHACSCTQHNDYKSKVVAKAEPVLYRNKYRGGDSPNVKKVWEPLESHKYVKKVEPNEIVRDSSPIAVEKSTLEKTGSVNSTSDNCSSCLSEGDSSNTSFSNTRNPESSSTSDSEDAATSTTTTQQCDQEKPPLEAKTTQNHENKKGSNVNLGVGPPQLPRGMVTPGLHFPVFQPPPPTIGYYHQQSPVSWQANGLMPFPQANPYLFATLFAYGVNDNPSFLPYGALPPPPPPPLLNVPVFKQEPNKKTGKTNVEKTGFSLFHFGGVDLSSGHQPEPFPTGGGGGGGEISSELYDENGGCNKKEMVEEYNLFAASNGITFSFF